MDIRSRYVKAYLGSSPSVAPKFWLVFPVSISPLGFSTYFVSTAKKTGYFPVFVICNIFIPYFHTEVEMNWLCFFSFFFFFFWRSNDLALLLFLMYVLNSLGSNAATSLTYSSRKSKNGPIEVGPGELKLSYDAEEGKLSHYSNTRSSVCFEIISFNLVILLILLTSLSVSLSHARQTTSRSMHLTLLQERCFLVGR